MCRLADPQRCVKGLISMGRPETATMMATMQVPAIDHKAELRKATAAATGRA
jgi:hypothetical protein